MNDKANLIAECKAAIARLNVAIDSVNIKLKCDVISLSSFRETIGFLEEQKRYYVEKIEKLMGV